MQKVEAGFSELLSKQPVTEQDKEEYIRELRGAVQTLLQEVRDLDEIVALLRKKHFGSSSEATPAQEEDPLGLFPEAEQEYREEAPEPFKRDQRGVHRMNEAGKWKLTNASDTEDRVYGLDEEDRACPRCGGRMECIGKELVREVFEYVPAKLKLVRYWQKSYRCPACRKNGRERHCASVGPEAAAEPQHGIGVCGGGGHVPEIRQRHAAVPSGDGVETAGCELQPDDDGELDHLVRGGLAGAVVGGNARRASAT